MATDFEALPIEERLISNLKERGISAPTDIQARAIPVIAAGKDVIAQSQTGTGKTLAYLLPVLQKLDASARHVQAVVLVPTRELGMQILQEIEKLIEGTELTAQPLIGGAALARQVDRLRQKPSIVVGTPGRIMELIKLRKLTMHYVRTIVVDEVDQMFDLGSAKEVESILGSALRDRQILFFSATVTEAIRRTAGRWMNEPEEIDVKPEQRTAETLEHLYFVTEPRDKIDMLRRLVRHYNPRSAIVFINETEGVAEVLAKIRYVGLTIEGLYGDAGKQDRARVMNGFREGRFQLLLATDVAARGLDIPEVTHVINLDLPMDADHYVHRAGRTGRMGRQGTVLSLAANRERSLIEKFAKTLGIPIEEKEMYSGEVVSPEENRSVRAGRQRVEKAGAGESVRTNGAAGTGAASSGKTAEAGAERRERPAFGAGGLPERPGAGGGRGSSGAGVQPAAGGGRLSSKDWRSVAAGGTEERQALQPEARKPAGAGKGRERDRERDRKNKGAPKWLKDKPAKDR
ncbi:DEAD/DEAH box helicase [Paenibacillus aurantius]|uniref:DEAD/DEAH box helicase n=1 Tax=Paenibacillus aurantius TaxID=2918900 RepID=A0AA96LIS7_9BACL|nr:DEAD/DEAH box helicase [Paenibacillus aurantius]WNQ12766.1 DEAD/DEAH box helicase [Paenibacillus aurantius]